LGCAGFVLNLVIKGKNSLLPEKPLRQQPCRTRAADILTQNSGIGKSGLAGSPAEFRLNCFVLVSKLQKDGVKGGIDVEEWKECFG
jgi:hypothetical protein